MLCDEDCRAAGFGKTERPVGWEGNGETSCKANEALQWGNLAATDTHLLPVLNHSFTLDFVVLHPSLEVIQDCQKLISQWLTILGLELKPSKTRITHTLDPVKDQKPGFDFLGFHIRSYPVGQTHSGKNNGKLTGFQTFIKPSKANIKAQYRKIAEQIESLKAAPQSMLYLHNFGR
jgi:hypothetical protein